MNQESIRHSLQRMYKQKVNDCKAVDRCGGCEKKKRRAARYGGVMVCPTAAKRKG